MTPVICEACTWDWNHTLALFGVAGGVVLIVICIAVTCMVEARGWPWAPRS